MLQILEHLDRRIQDEAARMGFGLVRDVGKQIAAYFELLSRWSMKIRLTGSRDPVELIERHFCDALALLSSFPSGHGLSGIDVGSGSGLPGLLAAMIHPTLRLTLVEANQRKCAFLRTAAHRAGLSCEIYSERVEDFLCDHRGEFDVAWSRATFSPEKWLNVGESLVHSTGTIHLFLVKKSAQAELSRRAKRVLEYRLADGTPRALLTIEKGSDLEF